MTAQCSACR